LTCFGFQWVFQQIHIFCSSFLADGLAQADLAEGGGGFDVLEAVDGVEHSLRVVISITLIWGFHLLAGIPGLLARFHMRGLLDFKLVEYKSGKRYVVFVDFFSAQKVLQLILEVLNLVHEEDVVAEARDYGVDLHEEVRAQLLLEVLANPLNGAELAHVNIVVRGLCQEGVAFVVAWVLARDEREALELVLGALVLWLVVVREVIVTILRFYFS